MLSMKGRRTRHKLKWRVFSFCETQSERTGNLKARLGLDGVKRRTQITDCRLPGLTRN